MSNPKTAGREEPGPDVVTAGDLVGLRRQEWPPERLRTLDRAVAEARGWTGGRLVKGYVPELWRTPDGTLRSLSAVSLGTGETFVLQDEARIHVSYDAGTGLWFADHQAEQESHGPTIPIAICLAYLAAKGRPFNG